MQLEDQGRERRESKLFSLHSQKSHWGFIIRKSNTGFVLESALSKGSPVQHLYKNQLEQSLSGAPVRGLKEKKTHQDFTFNLSDTCHCLFCVT